MSLDYKKEIDQWSMTAEDFVSTAKVMPVSRVKKIAEQVERETMELAIDTLGHDFTAGSVEGLVFRKIKRKLLDDLVKKMKFDSSYCPTCEENKRILTEE